MASPAKPDAKEKAALWAANKEKIGHLVSLGFKLSQIEEELMKNGCRITSQLREYIIWEQRAPEVRALLAKGLDVAAIEEKMRLNGWIWTDNLRKKALWEFHREEIIGQYQILRSVEAVREIMVKKGFTPQPRIYYAWLRCWGISTSINRPTPSETGPLSPQYRNFNEADGGLMVVDEEHQLGVLGNRSTWDPQTPDLVASSTSNSMLQPGPQGDHSICSMSAYGGSCSGANDDPDEVKDFISSHPVTTRSDVTSLLPASGVQFPNFLNRQPGMASHGEHGDVACLPGPMDHRHSFDSAYVSNNPSLQPTGVEYRSSRPASPMGTGLDPDPDGQERPPLNGLLHSIPCPSNHLDLTFNCDSCGSSCLQELALSVSNMQPQEVYERLCYYMRWKGLLLWDHAGNTFLHKLAMTEVPWEYFEAGLNAQINPCHRNASGQTFAHVLKVSAFRPNLTDCLASLRARGIDFGLRDTSGRTVLHCLFGQPMPPNTARQILKFIDVPGRLLSLRDVSGRTPCEIFKHTFLQHASVNPRRSTTELQLQMLGIFEDIVDGGVLRLKDISVDWSKIAENPHGLREALQNQYKQVIDNAKNGICVEAADGSNAFHAQAALMDIHDAPTDLCSLQKFISIGIDANDYDNDGKTPLEAIITQPRDYETELATSEKVSLLIDMGHANIQSRNRLGHTPLYSAAIRGLDRTVEALLLRGAHANIRANDNQSLLRAVIDAGHRAFVEYFESGYCLYHEALCSRIEECKVLLERFGAVPDPTPAQAMGYPARRAPLP